MWFRQGQRSGGTHERLPISNPSDEIPTEDNATGILTSSQEENSSPTNNDRSEPSDIPPQENEQTATDASIDPSTDRTPLNDEDDANHPSSHNDNDNDNASHGEWLTEGLNEVESEGDSETRQELIELAASRVLRRRRLFICILILSLLLLRLYIEAILSSDFALFWACLILTSWLMRWINSQREAEELIDGRMEHLWREDSRRSDNTDIEAMTAERRRQRRSRRNRQRNNAADDGEQELNIRMLSFQAQLSMAIMESQRHILMTGGFGRPDGENAEESRGVTDNAKRSWKKLNLARVYPL